MKKISGFSVSKKWAENEKLEGEIIEKKKVTISGKERDVVVIRDKENLEWSVFISAGLRSLLDLAIGDKVLIMSRGIKQLKDGRKFKMFDIYLIDDLEEPETEKVPF